MDRRHFFKISLAAATVGSGLILGFNLLQNKAHSVAQSDIPSGFPVNAFLHIAADETVTVILHKSEMGQGVYTSLPMLIAEELEADWSKIRVEMAPAHADYYHTKWGPFQGTGASTSVNTTWQQLRMTGAVAREMLIAAAAQYWNIPATQCYAQEGMVYSGKQHRLSFGKLAGLAAQMPIPDPNKIKLKQRSDFKVIGKVMPRLDVHSKINGSAQYGIDVSLPGMLTAVVLRPPVFGAKVKSVDSNAAKKVSGVRHIIQIDAGVAVVADHFWAARQARELLEVQWDEGPLHDISSETLRKKYTDLAQQPGLIAKQVGDISDLATKISTAPEKSRLTAVYELPYLAHAAMEPLNCVAHVQADGCDVWTGTQMQTTDQQAVAQITGHKIEAIRIHTTFLGGSFGRRANPHADYVREAVQISKQIGNLPVKVIWTREDDTRGGYYRPMHCSQLEAVLDQDGMPELWLHRLVSESIVKQTPFEKALTHHGIDHLSVEGASDHPYNIPHQLIEHHPAENDIPVLWWRSVGHSFTAFAVESFLDEIAARAGHDPYELRMQLLQRQPRHQQVLKLAAEKAGWKYNSGHKGFGQGIAIHKSFKSIVAQVAEVTMPDSGLPKVTRVVCVVDCGLAVDPKTIRAQMESGIVYGLSAMLYQEITLKQGRIEQSNFHDFPALRIEDMPQIEVYILETGKEMGGIGEVGTPPIAPAVCNAIYAATGQRIRQLPLRHTLSV